MSIGSHQSPTSQSCDWLTPPEWIRRLGPFDLDPCASVLQPWPTATTMWTERGLEQEWGPRFVWCNPPYGGPAIINPWLDAMARHDFGILCIFARTETAAWHKYVWPHASGILFVKGRPHFHLPITGARAKGNSGGPIALVGYGLRARERLEACDIPGRLV